MNRIIGECVAIPWDYCTPFFYGEYEGRLINGKSCKIDVDSKIKVYDDEGGWHGTDEIDIWYCYVNDIKSMLEHIEQRR